MHTAVLPDSSRDFSMVLGGPLYQLLLRLRVVREPLDLLTRRIIVIALVAWVPLLFLSVAGGRAWSGVKVPSSGRMSPPGKIARWRRRMLMQA